MWSVRSDDTMKRLSSGVDAYILMPLGGHSNYPFLIIRKDRLSLCSIFAVLLTGISLRWSCMGQPKFLMISGKGSHLDSQDQRQ